MTEQLTSEEIKALRELIKADQRRQWLISGVKAVALWVGAVATAGLVGKQLLADWFKW